MSQAYICDTCQKHEEPDRSYNLPPDGWYSLYQRRAGNISATTHYCSPTCLEETARAAMQAEEAFGQAPAEVA